MMKKVVLSVLFLFLWVGIFSAHDLFLKLDTYFLKPHTNISIFLINGTFEKSENIITRNRMLDVSIVVSKNNAIHPDTSQWRDAGTSTVLDFKTGDSGTYVAGVSTAPNVIKLSAKDFNEYLEHDGVLDVLAGRKHKSELGQEVRERYSKHVKAIMQVGDKRTSGFETQLGYPVEIIPLQNPYHLSEGDILKVLFLKDGKPVEKQLIYASYGGFHQHDGQGEHREAIQTRTDKDGIATLKLEKSGRWYVRLIHMVRVKDTDVDYESNWATLTFEIR